MPSYAGADPSPRPWRPWGETRSAFALQFVHDQVAQDLGGAPADLEQLGVARQALDRELADVAVASEHLDGVERGAGGGLGGQNLGGGGERPGPLAGVDRLRGPVDEAGGRQL